MSNVFASDVQKQVFKDGVQDELRDSLPMRFVSDIDTENTEYIHNRYGSDISAQSSTTANYRRATGFTYNEDKKSIDEYATATDEILYRELMRQGFDLVMDRTDRHAHALEKAIHWHSFRTTRQGAGSTLDDGYADGGANDGVPIDWATLGADDVASRFNQLLQSNNAFGGGNPYVMMSPKQAQRFNLFSMGAGFSVADRNLTNGYFTQNGTRVIRSANAFNGLDVIVTNEVETTEVLTFSGVAVAAETLSIVVGGGTVTFTAAAAPSAAGEFDVEASAEDQIDTIVAAINNSEDALASTASASGNYVELSQANRTILQDAGVKATKLSASTMEISAFGVSADTAFIAETLTNATEGTAIEHMVGGAYNSTTITLPSMGMRVDEKPLAAYAGQGTHGYELTTSQMHDAVVWTKVAPKIIDVLTT